MSEEEQQQEQQDVYVEEEDDDFNPEDEGADSDNSDDEQQPAKKHNGDEDFDVETESEVKGADYSKIESSSGGLIKTRHQRAVEQQQQGHKFKSVLGVKGNVDVEEAWKRLQEQQAARLKHAHSNSALQSSTHEPLVATERIKIKRKYEYAGETVVEEKWVDRESAEAREYLSTLGDKEQVESSKSVAVGVAEESKKMVNDRGQKLRIVRKRPPLLEGIINGSIKPKFNTLEKSKLDFAQFVDREGLNDELVHNTKDGYLGKQDFLSRVEFHRETQIKEARAQELQKKNQ